MSEEFRKMNLSGQTSVYNSEAYQDPTPINNSVQAGANTTIPSFRSQQEESKRSSHHYMEEDEHQMQE
jgi:hypothetical protein